jgi:hypothetical protein
MIKFASKNVVGWNDRHLNNTAVVERLYARMRNGFTLRFEERQFLDNYQSLLRQYNDFRSTYSLTKESV